MTTQEFSIEFDILYNNLASNAAPPLNEYEKSVFLTKAQSEIVLELYSGRNQLGLVFESNEEVRRYLLSLIKYDDNTTKIVSTYDESYKCYKHYMYRPVYNTESWNAFRPGLIIIREELHTVSEENKEYNIPIIPVTHDTLDATLRNPFKKPVGTRRALRLDSNYSEHAEDGGTWGSCTVIYTEKELDSENTSYREWYLDNPSPIILDAIDDSLLTINGISVTTPQECTLPPSIHRMILDRAVLLAKQAYVGGQA